MNTTLPQTEQSFVSQLQCGDEAACEKLVRQHGGRMLSVARRMLRNDEDAADAVQEAFIAAFKAIGRFAGGASLGTWLHRIVVNACLMRRRSASRRPMRSIEELQPRFDATGHHAEPVDRWARPVGDRLQQEEMRQQLALCLEQLPDDYREIVRLRDIEQRDTAETAALLNVSPSVVKTRLHRARLALRTLLNDVLQED